MLPFIIAAAASILSNQQKKRAAAQELYLDTLNRNAQRLGGDTRVADVYSGQKKINSMGADYGSALGLVGKLGGDDGDSSSGADGNPDDVFGPTSYAHDAGGVQYNDPVALGDFGGSDDVDNLLKGFKQDDPNNDDDFSLLGVRRRR